MWPEGAYLSNQLAQCSSVITGADCSPEAGNADGLHVGRLCLEVVGFTLGAPPGEKTLIEDIGR